MRKADAERRSMSKTVERKKQRLARKRENARKRRLAGRTGVSSSSIEVLSGDCELQARNRLAFQTAIGEYPRHVCMSCNKLCYRTVGSAVNEQEQPALYESLGQWGVSTCSNGWLCNRCKKKILAGKVPPFCIGNNLDAGVIPVELRCLNPLEVRLVSRVHCFMKVVVLKFGQKAVTGGCINFPVNTAEVCAKLPRMANDDGVILVHAGGFPGKPDGRWYTVSKEHVVNAVNWLVKNNALYSDVSVASSYTGTVVDYSSHTNADEPQVEMGVVRMDYTVPNVEVNDILVGKQNSHQVIHLGHTPRLCSHRANKSLHAP